MQFLGDSLKNCIWIKKHSVPVCRIIILFPHLSFFLLLEGRLLLHQISIFLLNNLLIFGLFCCADHLSDVLKRWLDMNNSTKHYLVVRLRKCSQGLFRFIKSQEAISFVFAIILLGQFDLADVAKASEMTFDFFFANVVRNIGDI